MKLDVPQLIVDLEEAGLADIEIALRVQVSASAVFDWKMGNKRPKLDTGLRLLAVHLQFCPNNSPLRTLFALKAGLQRADAESTETIEGARHVPTEIPERSYPSRPER